MSSTASISIAPGELKPRAAYQLLISAVVPRPIRWTSTIGSDGTLTLAPFSFFNAVSNVPLTVMISMGQRKGRPKDTLRNAQETAAGGRCANRAGMPGHADRAGARYYLYYDSGARAVLSHPIGSAAPQRHD